MPYETFLQVKQDCFPYSTIRSNSRDIIWCYNGAMTLHVKNVRAGSFVWYRNCEHPNYYEVIYTSNNNTAYTGYMPKSFIDTTYNAETPEELFFTFEDPHDCFNLEDTNNPFVQTLHLCLNRYYDSKSNIDKNSYWPYSHIYPSKTYSNKTMELVAEFQRREGLHVDGLAGNETLRRLAEWVIQDNLSR